MLYIFKKKTKIIPLIQIFIQEMKDETILSYKNKKYSQRSILAYKNLLFWLEQYQLDSKTIFLEEIDIPWFEKFSVFLINHKKTKNTLSSILISLKNVLKYLSKKKLTNFRGKGVWVGKEINPTIYNNFHEITLLMKTDFSRDIKSQFVRDLYIVQCFMGVSFKNLKKILLNINHYIKEQDGKRFFEFKTGEDNNNIVIPVAKIIQQILDRNNGNLQFSFPSYYYNRKIKKIARKAGIDAIVMRTRTIGGELIETPLPKYQLMSSDTARKSFAINACISKIPDSIIMFMLDLTDYGNFMNLIRGINIEHARKNAQYSLFKRSHP